jgi:adenylosuccinate synthase
MLIDPLAMMREAEALNRLTDNVWWRTTADADAVIVTPFHRALNRLRENARGEFKHGSCGRGIGVAREMHLMYGDRVLLVKDMLNSNLTMEKLYSLRDIYLEEVREHQEYDISVIGELDVQDILYDYTHWPITIVDHLEPAETMVFEGAQGVMLDEKHGTAPHNTWTNTTFENADTLLDEVGGTDRMRIGCLRTYYTRFYQNRTMGMMVFKVSSG